MVSRFHNHAMRRMIPRRMIPIAACAMALSAGVAAWLWRERTAPPLDLLAKAYSSQRLLEYRIPGAEFAPMATRRSLHSDPPAELLQSQLRIQRALFKGSNQAAWFHAKGRAELIQRRYDDAIRSLQMASDLGADSADFLTDFGTAYAGRAEEPNAALDYTRSIELFSTALRRDPYNAAALCNRGTAKSRLSLLDGALRDLTRCAQLEKGAQWRAAAETQAAALGNQRRIAFDPARRSSVASDEALLEKFMRQPPESNSAAAFAGTLALRHHDTWLEEVVHLPSSPVVVRALSVLSALARLRTRFQVEKSSVSADDLQWIRAAQLPRPLATWRDFELLFRVSNSLESPDCVTQRESADRARRNGYLWLAAQQYLELSTCNASSGRLDTSASLTQTAIDLAKRADYPTAVARATGFLVTHLILEGRNREGIELARALLAEIMTGAYPLNRAHQFFLMVGRASAALGRWESARDSLSMAVAVAQAFDLKSLQMYGLLEHAEYSLKLGLEQDSRQAVAAAARIAASYPPDEGIQAMFAYFRARVAAQESNYSLVTAAEPLLKKPENLFLTVPYLNLRANYNYRHGALVSARTDAEEALRRALAQPDSVRRFRTDDSEAADLLIRILLSEGATAEALRTWRQEQRRAAEIPPAPASSPVAGQTRIALSPVGEDLGLFIQAGEAVTYRRAGVTQAQGLKDLRRLVALASNPRSSLQEIERLAATLSAALWAGSPPPSRLISLQTKGEWANLPLALVTPPGTAPSFATPGSQPSACHATSGSALLAQASEVSEDWRSRLPRLPFLETEREDLQKAVPGIQFLQGARVTVPAMTKALLDYRWVHFSGHAVTSRQRTALALSPTPDSGDPAGLFTFGSQSPICSELLFLAACSTADFKALESVSASQLAAEAVRAGARYVVAALWDVDSVATTRLEALFYTGLSAGSSPAAALADAIMTLRRDPAFSHPYYWAPFVVVERS